MKTKVGLGISLAVHLLLLFFVLPISPEIKKDIIEIDIQDKPVYNKPNDQGSVPPKQSPGPRLGSDKYIDEITDLGRKLLVEDYLRRLKERIDPNWIRFLREELGRRKPRECSVTLNIDANANGLILSMTVVETCGWKLAEDVALKAVDYSGLLPPPKDLLKNGILYLTWIFEIHK